jgi:hypothetical protein
LCYFGREVRLSEEERLFIDALREMNQQTAKAAAATGGHSSGSDSDEHGDDEHFRGRDCDRRNGSVGESSSSPPPPPCGASVVKGQDVLPMHTPPSGVLATKVRVAAAETNSEEVVKEAESDS